MSEGSTTPPEEDSPITGREEISELSAKSPIEREPSATVVNIKFWKPYDAQTNKGGFGFVETHQKDKDAVVSVMIPISTIYPPVGKGSNPIKHGLVLRDEDVDWKAPRGARAQRIFASEDAYQEWLHDEAIARERDQQRKMEQEMYAQQERVRKDEAREKWQEVMNKLKRIYELQAVGNMEFVPHQLRDAMTAEVVPQDVLLLHCYSTWGNDGPSDDGFGSRSGARSYQVFESTDDYLIIKGTAAEQDPSLISGPTTIATEYAKVRVRGPIAPYNYLNSERVGEPIQGGKGFSADTRYTFYNAVPSNEGDKVFVSEYTVPVTDAEKIWEHSKWWDMYPEDFAVAYAAAQKVMAARSQWEKEFPGIAPGDLTAIQAKYNLQRYAPTDVLPYDKAMNMEWLKHVYWYVPDIFSKPEEDLLNERRAKLVDAYKAGDTHAAEILKYESRELLKADIWDTIEATVGQPLHRETRPNDDFWDTVLFVPEDRNHVPDYRGYVVDSAGKKIQVARMDVYQNVPDAKPFYRVYVDANALNVPEIYFPNELKWEEIVPPTYEEIVAERQAEYDRLTRLVSEGDASAQRELEGHARDWMLEDLQEGLSVVSGMEINRSGSYLESDFILDHGNTVPVYTAHLVADQDVEVARTAVWYGNRNGQPYYRLDYRDDVTYQNIYRPGSVKWLHSFDAPSSR